MERRDAIFVEGPTKDLIGETDPRIWAKEFMMTFGDYPIAEDQATMTTWFANAIMAGVDSVVKGTTDV